MQLIPRDLETGVVLNKLRIANEEDTSEELFCLNQTKYIFNFHLPLIKNYLSQSHQQHIVFAATTTLLSNYNFPKTAP